MSEDMKEVQHLTLGLLKKFMEICRTHHLRWYFTGGALIGVLRHGGFIPWDDDIDIGMPRKDYEKLLLILSKDMPEGYGLCSRFTNPDWHFGMSQFQDMKTEIETDLWGTPRRTHIWLDIFPLDGLPADPAARKMRIAEIMTHRYLIQAANVRTQVDTHRERPGYEKAAIRLLKAFPAGRLLNTQRLLDELDGILRRDDFDDSAWAGNMLGRYREKEAVPRCWFGKPVKGMFEGIEVNIPAESDRIERQLYGDYMQLPPENERGGHYIRLISSGRENGTRQSAS